MTEAEMEAAIRSLVGDPFGDIVPSGTIRLNLHRAAKDFNRRTRCVRLKRSVTYTASPTAPAAYLLFPRDCLQPIRVTDSLDRELPFISMNDLNRLYGPRSTWDVQQGTPLFLFRDETGIDRARLWPQAIAGDTVTMYYFAKHVIGDPIQTPADYHETLVYGGAARSLANRRNQSDKAKRDEYAQNYEAGVEDALEDSDVDFLEGEPTFIPYRHD